MHVRECVCVRACIPVRMHAYILSCPEREEGKRIREGKMGLHQKPARLRSARTEITHIRTRMQTHTSREWVCMCTWFCLYFCMYVCMHVRVRACVLIYLHLCMHGRTCVGRHTRTCVGRHTRVSIYVCTYVCLYICLIHTHTTHTHTHTNTQHVFMNICMYAEKGKAREKEMGGEKETGRYQPDNQAQCCWLN